jgi:hypothetical protein
MKDQVKEMKKVWDEVMEDEEENEKEQEEEEEPSLDSFVLKMKKSYIRYVLKIGL